MNTITLTLPAGVTRELVLEDYKTGFLSRQCSLLGRKEVFAGKAKFGIFGDGKEVPQLTMARAFQKGDFRSGYYRDQTFMMAIGELTPTQFFAQLYAHASLESEPHSAGRQMTCHFATRSLNAQGQWNDLTQIKNSSSDISPTAGQMPRLLGLAYASKLFRQNEALHAFPKFSKNGNEIAFGTIGNASTSEGLFFESMNAAGVLQVPMLLSVWDDDYGISVPKEYHTTKGSISDALAGFQRTETQNGFEMYVVKGWDYAALLHAYFEGAALCRTEHVPVMIHVTELTQPQGHSTSGSHERYKSKERLEWEKNNDCLVKMREWMLETGLASTDEIDAIENEAIEEAKTARTTAWKTFLADIQTTANSAIQLIQKGIATDSFAAGFQAILKSYQENQYPIYADIEKVIYQSLRLLKGKPGPLRTEWLEFKKEFDAMVAEKYNTYLYSQTQEAVQNFEEIAPEYSEASPVIDGREILQACFTAAFERNPLIFAIGEDVGKIGDVNQGFAGLQEKFGEIRITDTGIRECTIVGQGIGAAMRGLRPIVEIQYLDYIMYAIQIMSDDLASVLYRTKGGQKAPLIIRTRGHRLEGVWHAGSPMGTILSCLRGMVVCVPRNMTQAAGMYNTLLLADEPALVIECLNGYRLKERLPENVGSFQVKMGMPEILQEGNDLTIVTYGSMCKVVMDGAALLQEAGISVEVIDVQTLLPFDLPHLISKSIQKTGKVIFADEDVPGGASAYMMQQVLENQDAYHYLDSKPRTISAQAHRPAYASDGDHFSKPSADTVFEVAYALMHEMNPSVFPALF